MTETDLIFTDDERTQLRELYRQLLECRSIPDIRDNCHKIRLQISTCLRHATMPRNQFGMNRILADMQTALILTNEIGMQRTSLLAVLLRGVVKHGLMTLEQVEADYGHDVTNIIKGLLKINELYTKSPAIESENFRKLLLLFAEDMRVIFIMIADRLNLMRQIRDTQNEDARLKVANEAAYLYAPLAHKLGLYRLKSELEDLALKYTQHDAYYHIREKLNATKAARDAYITQFIEPVERRIAETGLKFHIKGRTKSIHSIYAKMQKQQCTFEGVYDLFAIRIIIDTDLAHEKQACWQAYSIVTDMYRPNPKRLRDWLSVPKSNGYESLHITVMGPEGKWVEVQIRTERMDLIAECGVAAHWRYKGVKSEQGIDAWLTQVREAIENTSSDDIEAMMEFKMELNDDEVFVFTPKGDLFKLPKDASVLDFAYSIHTKLGCKCIGAKVNGRNVSIRQRLSSGDQVEILTQNAQVPKRDWLNYVVTSRARTKIKQALKELEARQTQFAREAIERKFKNRKMDYDEPTMMRLIKKMGYKIVTEFYQDVANEKIDVNELLDRFAELQRHDNEHPSDTPLRADTYNLPTATANSGKANSDVLVIDKQLKGLDYSLAKCCNPIYGDDVFGFVTVNGGIKVHRCNCPNAAMLRERFGYRIVEARWAGKHDGQQYAIRLHVVGVDDIGIVTNITSVINKEPGVLLRSININSDDGLFSGMLTVMVDNTLKLNALVKKIQMVKGVKQVTRN